MTHTSIEQIIKDFDKQFPILCAPLKDREGFTGEKVRVAQFIQTHIKELLESIREAIEAKKLKFAEDADTETHGAYLIKGMNIGYKEAAHIITKYIV